MSSKLNKANYKALPIDVLILADWNYKTNNDALQKKLVENMNKSGQIENILVRELKGGKFEVVNGNHRLLALKELGYEEVMTYNLGKISDAQAKRIAIETNETKFGTDNFKLATILNDLQLEFDDLELTMPFSEGELDNFSKLLEFEWPEDDEGGLNNEGHETGVTIESGPKSETVISAGTDKFKTIKLEVSPEVHALFHSTLSKFTAVEPNPETAFSLMLTMLNDKSDEQISEFVKASRPRKVKKK